MKKMNVYKATYENKIWEVKCELTKRSEDVVVFDVSARGSQFTVCIVKWFEGFGFKQYGALVPNWNVGIRFWRKQLKTRLTEFHWQQPSTVCHMTILMIDCRDWRKDEYYVFSWRIYDWCDIWFLYLCSDVYRKKRRK